MDENNVLKDFSVSYPGVIFSIMGTNFIFLRIKRNSVQSPQKKELPSSIPGVVTGGTKYWLRDEYQNVVTFDVKGSAKPVKCYFSLEIKAGTLQLEKLPKMARFPAFLFIFPGMESKKRGDDRIGRNHPGRQSQAGTYTVTERAPDKYVQPESNR